jgi:hypothetical protein
VILVRGLVKGLLESSSKMARAEMHQLGKRYEGQGFGEVRFDRLIDRASLPGGKPATTSRFRARSVPVKARQLGDQHQAERLHIEKVDVGAALDFLRQLFCGRPERCIFEEQARGKLETLAEIGRSYNVSGWTISRLR